MALLNGDIVGIISSVGFPIVIALLMAWYIKYIDDKHDKEINRLNSDHKKELLSMVDAVNNNTSALNLLTAKMAELFSRFNKNE